MLPGSHDHGVPFCGRPGGWEREDRGFETPIPVDPFIAEDLLCWYRATKYNRPEDYVFATDAPRAGKKRGKQPVWLSKVMQYHLNYA